MRLVLLIYLFFVCIFMDTIKSELLTLTFQSDCEDWSSYQTTTLLLQSERLNKLRFTLLATTVYLSHPPSLTPSCNFSSNRFPECIRNKGCFIFFYKRLKQEIIFLFISIKNEFSRQILIKHTASETLKCLNTTEHDSYISVCMP